MFPNWWRPMRPKPPDKDTFPFRVRYKLEDGTEGAYFVMEENTVFAALDFTMRTGHSRESIISVEPWDGKSK